MDVRVLRGQLSEDELAALVCALALRLGAVGTGGAAEPAPVAELRAVWDRRSNAPSCAPSWRCAA